MVMYFSSAVGAARHEHTPHAALCIDRRKQTEAVRRRHMADAAARDPAAAIGQAQAVRRHRVVREQAGMRIARGGRLRGKRRGQGDAAKLLKTQHHFGAAAVDADAQRRGVEIDRQQLGSDGGAGQALDFAGQPLFIDGCGVAGEGRCRPLPCAGHRHDGR